MRSTTKPKAEGEAGVAARLSTSAQNPRRQTVATGDNPHATHNSQDASPSKGTLEREFSVTTVKSFWETKQLTTSKDIREVSEGEWEKLGLKKDGKSVRPIGSKASTWVGPRSHHRAISASQRSPRLEKLEKTLPLAIDGPSNLLDLLQNKATALNEADNKDTKSEKEKCEENGKDTENGETLIDLLQTKSPRRESNEAGKNDASEESSSTSNVPEEGPKDTPERKREKHGKSKEGSKRHKHKDSVTRRSRGSKMGGEVKIKGRESPVDAIIESHNAEEKKRPDEYSPREDFKEAVPKGRTNETAAKRLSFGEIGEERKYGSHIVRPTAQKAEIPRFSDDPRSLARRTTVGYEGDDRADPIKPSPRDARKDVESVPPSVAPVSNTPNPTTASTPAASTPRRKGHSRSRSTGLMGLGNIISRGSHDKDKKHSEEKKEEEDVEEKISTSSGLRLPFLHSRTPSHKKVPSERPLKDNKKKEKKEEKERKKEKEKEKDKEKEKEKQKEKEKEAEKEKEREQEKKKVVGIKVERERQPTEATQSLISESRPFCKDGADCVSCDPYHFLEYQHTSMVSGSSSDSLRDSDEPLYPSKPATATTTATPPEDDAATTAFAARRSTLSNSANGSPSQQRRLSLKKKLEPFMRGSSSDDRKSMTLEFTAEELARSDDGSSGGSSGKSSPADGSSPTSSQSRIATRKKKRHSFGSLTDFHSIRRHSASEPNLPSQLEQLAKLNEAPPSTDHIVHNKIMQEWRQSKMLSAEGGNKLFEALKAMAGDTYGGPPLCLEIDGWNVERGDNSEYSPDSVPLLEEEDHNTPFYKLHFYNHPHEVFYGVTRGGPILLSVVDMDTARHILPAGVKLPEKQPEKIYRVLVQTKKGPKQLFIKSGSKPKDKIKAVKLVCESQSFLPEIQEVKFKEVKEALIKDELLRLEKLFFSSNHKFGVLYCKKGQDENQMFSNDKTSTDFDAFLSQLGDKIALKGWKDYTGGLDAKTETTGKESIFRNYKNLGIMFHVSTMLPYFPKDEQQVERKRHLGNDIGVIVYVEEGGTFDPSSMTTQFNHIYGVVSKQGDNMRMEFVSKDGVRPFGPRLPSSYPFKLDPQFIDFLLAKMINGERAALAAHVFASKLEATRRALLQGVLDKLAKAGAT